MAKCKNCTKCLMGEDVFIHGAIVYPFCGVDGEEIENLDEDKECIDFECMTNADRIRAMTDEQLADLITNIHTEWIDEYEYIYFVGRKQLEEYEDIVAWLKSEMWWE